MRRNYFLNFIICFCMCFLGMQCRKIEASKIPISKDNGLLQNSNTRINLSGYDSILIVLEEYNGKRCSEVLISNEKQIKKNRIESGFFFFKYDTIQLSEKKSKYVLQMTHLLFLSDDSNRFVSETPTDIIDSLLPFVVSAYFYKNGKAVIKRQVMDGIADGIEYVVTDEMRDFWDFLHEGVIHAYMEE